MPEARRDKGLIALAIGFAMLAAAVLATLVLFQRHVAAQREVVHTLRVQEQLSRILSHLQDTETGQRGFLITGDRAYLKPFLDGRTALGGEFVALRGMVEDNVDQVRATDRLARLAFRRIARLEIGIGRKMADASYDAGPALRGGQGKPLMDACRTLVAAMKAREDGLLTARFDVARRQSGLLTTWLVGAAAAVALLAFVAVREARRRALQAIAARDALEVTNIRLVEEAANRAAAEAQVRQMQKMESIGQLTGGVAHDFNNMLAIVIGSLDLAKRRLDKDPVRAAECIDNAVQGAERAAQLTARLLAFSRQQPLAPRAVDVNRLVGGMSELLRRTIGEQVQFETVLAGGLWPALIDGAQLENAVINLSVNARDAMPEGGRLTIETSNTHLDDAYAATHDEVAAGQYVMVSVTDTGTGMPRDVMERAFDPFFTTKEVGKGTGLGLSQVFGFVKQSGGHVKIYSEPGHGTTVKLYLKRHFGEAETGAESAEGANVLPEARAGETILVVEDEARVRRMSVDALRELGYLVLHASDGEQALAKLGSEARIDLLFTDVIMPGMNGRKLAEKAREMRPGLKVLYTTGYTKNAIVHNGVLDHDVAFLAKPFTVVQLAGKIRAVLDA